MEIAFRKTTPKVSKFFEWSPDGNRWYNIHRNDIRFEGRMTPEKYTEARKILNAALAGLICKVRARYSRKTKILEIEP